MCNFRFVKYGRPADYGDGVLVYSHGFDGVMIRTHRTVRTSPAGWVWGIEINGNTVKYGYAPTQKRALDEAAHMLSGPCGYVPKHRATGWHRAWSADDEYVGKRVAA